MSKAVIYVYTDERTRKRLRVLAATEGRTLSELANEAIQRMLASKKGNTNGKRSK